MERDFTEASKQQLLKIVNDVENEKWSNFTDWVGDRWYDFESWIGKLNIKNYLNDVNTYHKKVIDKNNTTSKKIIEIFDNVNDVSNNYKNRFASLLSLLQSYRKNIIELSEIVNPSNGKFVIDYIQKNLTNQIETFVNDSSIKLKAATDGLTIENNESEPAYENDIVNMVKKRINNSLIDTISAIVDFLPNLKLGDSVSIPIDAGTTLSYKVSGTVNNMSDADLNFAIENNKLKLKDFSYSTDIKGKLKIGYNADINGGPTVSVSDKNTSVSFNKIGEIEGSASTKIDNTTYKIKIKMDSITGGYTIEESVTTDLDSGSITTTISIKKGNVNRGLRNVPNPSPVPADVKIPEVSHDSSQDWETVGVGFSILMIIGIGMAIPTGGTSLALVLV